MTVTLLVPFLILSASLHLALGFLSLNRRFPYSRYAFMVLASIAVYQLGYSLEILSPELQEKLFWSKVQYIGIPLILLSLSFFVTGFSNIDRKPFPVYAKILWIIPVSVTLLRWTDEWHGLVYSSVRLIEWQGHDLLDIEPGPVYWFQICMHYFNSLFSSFLMFRFLKKSTGNLLKGSILLTAMTLLPFLGLFAYVFRIGPVDPSPFTLALAGPLFARALFQLRLFSISPVARDTVLETLETGVLVLDKKHKITDFNRAWESMLPSAPKYLLGSSIDLVMPELSGLLSNHDNSNKPASTIKISERHFDLAVNTLPDGTGKTIAFYETTQRRELEKRLMYLSFHDALTGLYNRAFFNEELDRARKSRSFPVGFLVIDLNGLKSVNDSKGHAAGDILIQKAAEAIRAPLRSHELVARTGGDEFQVMIPNCTESALAAIQERICTDLCSSAVSASCGAAIAVSEDEIPDALALADARMYEDKNRGRVNA